MPSKAVICKDRLVRQIVSPEVLKRHLDLYFLHEDVVNALDSSQIESLGVEKITTEHLLLIGQSATVNWSNDESVDGRLR